MKITSELGNTKADKKIKRDNLLGAHHRLVRHEGKVYKILVEKLGWMVLASAIDEHGKEINLDDKDKLAKDIRKLCENKLYT